MTPPPSLQTEADRDAEPTFAETLRSACVELMADYGLCASLDERSGVSDPAHGALTAAAEFAGEYLQGTVVLRATPALVLRTSQAGASGGDSQALLSDWICELVNQLLGRMKNKLRRFDLALNAGLPHLMSSDDSSRLRAPIRQRFVCEAGAFSGYVDIVVTPEFVLTKRDILECPIEEGDVVFF